MKVELVNLTKTRLSESSVIKRGKKVFAAMSRLGMWPKKNYAVYLIFIGRKESQKINKAFLGKNRPANVLSFDYGDFGEILLTPHVIKKEAFGLGVAVPTRISNLINHGALHLAGMHHEKSRRAADGFNRAEERVSKMAEGRGGKIGRYR